MEDKKFKMLSMYPHSPIGHRSKFLNMAFHQWDQRNLWTRKCYRYTWVLVLEHQTEKEYMGAVNLVVDFVNPKTHNKGTYLPKCANKYFLGYTVTSCICTVALISEISFSANTLDAPRPTRLAVPKLLLLCARSPHPLSLPFGLVSASVLCCIPLIISLFVDLSFTMYLLKQCFVFSIP